MFTLNDGPTAIRPEMTRALALSVADVEQSGGSRPETVRGGLAAVWNGRAGQVIVVVRFVERGVVDRYAWTERIRSESELDYAIREGIACAENLGLQMDDTEFLSLPPEKQKERIRLWNQLRKPGRSGVSDRLASTGPPSRSKPSAAAPKVAPAPKRSKPAVGERSSAESSVASRAVLGRVAVVRRKGSGSREAIGRILASY